MTTETITDPSKFFDDLLEADFLEEVGAVNLPIGRKQAVAQALARSMRRNKDVTDVERQERAHYLARACAEFLNVLQDCKDQDRGLSLDEALDSFESYPGVHRRILGAVPKILSSNNIIEPSGHMAITERQKCNGGIRRCWRLVAP